MHSFVLLAYASLAASRTLWQRLLTCLNFTLDSKDLSFWYKRKEWFLNYGSSTSSWKPWRWVKLDLRHPMRDIYINSNLNPLTKFISSRRSTEFKDILPWNASQMITKDRPNQYNDSHKQCDEMGHPLVNMMESQWKLRQQHDQNFLMEGKPL